MKKFFKFVMWGFLGIVALSIFASMGDDDSTTTSSDSTENTTETANKETKKKEQAKTYTVGQAVKVGDFEVTVTKVEETKELKSGNEFIENVTTEGKLVVLEYKVKNLDKEARMVDGEIFRLKGNGAEFEPMADGDIMMVLGDKNLFLEEVNPQMTRTGTVVFEAPSDLAKYSLEVSSGLGWSGGEYESIKLK